MEWLLRRARIEDNIPLLDFAIENGRIAAIGPDLPVTAAKTWDLAGRVVLPGLVDAHCHLDKTNITGHNKSGTLREAIDIWLEAKQGRTYAEIQAAARKALHRALTHGVTAMRSHVDVGDQNDLVALEAILDLREQMRHMIDLQIVALGYLDDHPENRAALEDALAMGADVVGGAPAFTADPNYAFDTAFALAERFGKPLDFHIDETEDPNCLMLEYLAEQTINRGMQGQVTAGHCCSLAFVDEVVAERVISKVAEAHLNLITLPSCNLVLMGRGMRPMPRGMTPVKELLAHGINVSAASDNVQDPFNPFGDYDLLHIANLNAHAAHMSGESEIYTCLQMVTTHPARTLGLRDYGLVEGAIANLVVVDTDRVADALLTLPARLATFKAGKLIVQTSIERTWYQSNPNPGGPI